MHNVLQRYGSAPRSGGMAEDFAPVTLETHRPARGFVLLRTADLCIAAIFLVAALAARAPFIIHGETLLHSDEAIVGIMSQDIAEARRFPIYFYGQRYMGALEAYVIAAISLVVHNPIHALRMGPAIFFAIFCALQYLMLARWAGRSVATIAAISLIAAPPMFMQWSISARGGYIEILVWGTALIWAYTEWFAPGIASREGAPERVTSKQLIFGLIVGSGLWINPSIMFFVVPIAAHYLLNSSIRLPSRLTIIRQKLGGTALAVFTLAAVLILNVLWSVDVENGRVNTAVLLNFVPRSAALVAGATCLLIACWKWNVKNRIMGALARNGGVIAGVLIGATPALLYVALTVLGLAKMDPALPLGFRPLWKTGETMLYLANGLPLLFGADPRAFEELVTMGRESPLRPLAPAWDAIMPGLNLLVAASMFGVAGMVIMSLRAPLSRLLRLEFTNYQPVVLLLLGLAGTISLYVLGGCAHDFNTIRYLLPVWVFVPGLLGIACVNRRFPIAGRAVVITLLGCWGLGQIAMASQIGNDHPLRQVAVGLGEKRIERATAEIFDAHLLTYLTGQQTRLREHRPFWARLDHLHSGLETPKDYLVHAGNRDYTQAWIDTGMPGPPPPETRRSLCLSIASHLRRFPGDLVSRMALPGGYELITLCRPLPGDSMAARGSN